MIFKVEEQSDVVIATLPGETLDASNAKDFKAGVAGLMLPKARVVFDMSQLKFVDSSGLGAILSCLRRLHDIGGELKLCAMNKPVRALFELVRMHRVFEIFNSREEAVRSYSVGEQVAV